MHVVVQTVLLVMTAVLLPMMDIVKTSLLPIMTTAGTFVWRVQIVLIVPVHQAPLVTILVHMPTTEFAMTEIARIFQLRVVLMSVRPERIAQTVNNMCV